MLIKPRKNRKKGFTLIELIVVVAILAILAAIAVPSFVGLQARAQEGVDIANASAIAGAMNTYCAMNTGKTLADATKANLTTAGLWPSFNESGTKLADAQKRIITTTGVATVNVSNPYVAAP
jgi:prepilin-type N-terminal cleavage/methylation domain-containing protein